MNECERKQKINMKNYLIMRNNYKIYRAKIIIEKLNSTHLKKIQNSEIINQKLNLNKYLEKNLELNNENIENMNNVISEMTKIDTKIDCRNRQPAYRL